MGKDGIGRLEGALAQCKRAFMCWRGIKERFNIGHLY